MFIINMLRMYELPEHVEASEKTRRRYAKYARWFYDNVSNDVRTERRNSQLRNLNNDTRQLFTHEELEYDLEMRARAISMKFISSTIPKPYPSDYTSCFTGLYLPTNRVLRIRAKYGAWLGGRTEYIVNTSAPTLPLELSLQISRSVEPTQSLSGETFHPVRFPYVTTTLFYEIENTTTDDYNYHLSFAKLSANAFYTKPKYNLFYNPIQNIVENYLGAQVI